MILEVYGRRIICNGCGFSMDYTTTTKNDIPTGWVERTHADEPEKSKHFCTKDECQEKAYE